MVTEPRTDAEILAALYDQENGWDDSDDFYLGLVLEAEAVLDIGCGTGGILGRARAEGHRGRLTGLDPDPAMLEHARRHDDVEWVLGDLDTVSWDGEFTLAFLSAHVFQVFLDDDHVRRTLRDIHRALRPGGLLAFETRNPAVGAWRTWNSPQPTELVDSDGTIIRSAYRVISSPDDDPTTDVVTFSETLSSDDWEAEIVAEDRLRFLDHRRVDAFLAEAGFTIEHRFGDWHRGGFEEEYSREIITIARRRP